LYKGLKKEERQKRKQLKKEAGPSDQKTNAFTPLENPHIYTGDSRYRKHQLLIEGGVKTLPFLTGFALEKA